MYKVDYLDQSAILADSIENLFCNRSALEQLYTVRGQPIDGELELPDELTDVFDACLPIIRRLTNWRDRLDPDITAENQLRVWESLVLRFEWQRYDDEPLRAVGALVNYMGKIVKGRQNGQKESTFVDEINPSMYSNPVSREFGNPEDILIEKEEIEEVRAIVERWMLMLSPLQQKVVDRRLFKRMSNSQIAEEIGVSEDVVRQKWYIALNRIKTIFNIPDNMSKEDGDKEMRRLFMLRPNLVGLLPPKMFEAVNAFYGLGEQKATYDIRQTAQIIGVSESNCRQLLSQGRRIILGIKNVSRGRIERRKREDLFIRWRNNEKRFDLNQRQREVLGFYFEEGLSCEMIAKTLGISDETVRRSMVAALSIIENM